MKEMTSIVCLLFLSSCLVSCKSELKVPDSKTESITEVSDINLIEKGVAKTKNLEIVNSGNDSDILNETDAESEEVGDTKVQKADKPAQKLESNKAQKTSPIITKVTSTIQQEQLDNEGVTASQEPIIDQKLEKHTADPKEEINELKEVIVDKVSDTQKLTPKDAKPTEELKVATKLDMHQEWNYLLSTYVSPAGKVNYDGILKEKNRLENYLALISNNTPNADWSRNKKLAYWINAYNAYTVKMIIDNYPLKSITDLEGGKPRDKKWIKIGAKTYSLNNIENDIIRPDFKEPRIHFAVNCAANSCPPLRNEAWNPEKLEQQFDSSTKQFVNNSAHNTIENGKAKVSKIFEWYVADFNDLKGFLKKYSGKTIDEITYNDYDWSLNN